jgi:hypothetical protein
VEPVVLVGLVSFVALLGVVALLWKPRPHERLGAERSYAAEAEVEEDDIGQMIEARNAIRRRRGLPEIGEEIAETLRRSGTPPPPPTR